MSVDIRTLTSASLDLAIVTGEDFLFSFPAIIPAPVQIKSSTNASPIQITTRTPHGFSNGDTVIVSGHGVNDAANGSWVIAVVDTNNFTLTGSTGNGVGGTTGTVGKALDLTGMTVKCNIVAGPGGDNIISPSITTPSSSGIVQITIPSANTTAPVDSNSDPVYYALYDVWLESGGYKAKVFSGQVKFTDNLSTL